MYLPQLLVKVGLLLGMLKVIRKVTADKHVERSIYGHPLTHAQRWRLSILTLDHESAKWSAIERHISLRSDLLCSGYHKLWLQRGSQRHHIAVECGTHLLLHSLRWLHCIEAHTWREAAATEVGSR